MRFSSSLQTSQYIPSKNLASNTICLLGAQPTGNVSPTTHHWGSPHMAMIFPISWIKPTTCSHSLSGWAFRIPENGQARTQVWFDSSNIVYRGVFKYYQLKFVLPFNKLSRIITKTRGPTSKLTRKVVRSKAGQENHPCRHYLESVIINNIWFL